MKNIKSIVNLFLIIILIVSCKKKETSYDTNGNLILEVPIKNGKRNGVLKQYFKEGSLQLTATYINGIKSGEVIEYYKNGNIKVKGYYENNEPEGTFYIYDSLSKLKLKYQAIKGKRDGKIYEYYPNGNILSAGFYKNDLPDGKGFHYYPDGDIKYQQVFKKGKLIYQKKYDKKGNLEESLLKVNVSPQNQSKFYNSGSKVDLTISIEYSEYDSCAIGLIIGSLDKEYQLVDTLDMLGNRGLSIDYSFEVKETGKCILTGKVLEVKLPEELVSAQYYFEYEYEVK